MRRETFLAIVIAAVVLFFANLPFVYGYFVPKDGMYFLGRKAINTYDTYTYVSFIEQARQGRFGLENLYSIEPQEPRLIRPLYITLGKASLITNISPDIMYSVSRIALGVVFCFVLYKFLKYFFEKRGEHLFAFAIVLTSTGLGYLLGFLFPSSSDTWIPESNTFLSLGEAPHFILSQILMLLGFIFFIKSLTSRRILNTIICAACLLLLSFEHPFNIFITFGTILITSIILAYKKKINSSSFFGIFVILAIQIIGIGHQVFETVQNSVFRMWQQNNNLPSPAPMNFIIGYGLMWPFVFIGAERFLRRENPWRILVVVWVALTFILLYSPLSFQRRVSEGVHIPLAILAAAGILVVAQYVSDMVLEKAKKVVYKSVIIGSVLVLAVGSVYLSIAETARVSQDSYNSYTYYLKEPEVRAMRVLRDNTTIGNYVLANNFYGNLIPGISGRKVLFGHGVQTPFFDEKIQVTDQFLLSKDDKLGYKFLKDNNIDFIFLGIDDSMISYGFNPSERPYLEKAYDYQGVQIYHVK